MNAVPVLYSSDVRRSLAFYTGILDFAPRWPQHLELSLSNGVLDLVCDAAIIQFSMYMGMNPTPSSVNIELASPAEVDALFVRSVSRGLDQSHMVNSPGHLAPLDQTWGTREAFINDPDGNCLCLRAWR